MSSKQSNQLDQDRLIEIMKDIYYKGQQSNNDSSLHEMINDISQQLRPMATK